MRRGVFAIFVVLVLAAGACTNGDDAELGAFNGNTEVVAVEPNAQPAEEDPTGAAISGAVIVDEAGVTGLEDCAAADDGFRVFIDENTSFSPAEAEQDLEVLRGETVSVSGRVTKRDDVCTPVADAIGVRGADADATTSPGAGGASTGTAPPGTEDDPDDDATAPPEATTSPNDRNDEGSITDPEETTSPAPENP